MANEAYINNGTKKLFNGEAAADVAISVEGIANGTGRVSAQYNLTGTPRPYRFKWTAECQWQATPTQGGVLELYIATAPDWDATKITGDVGNADAALADVDMRRNLQYIGCIVSENAAAAEICRASGEFTCVHQYLSLVVYNAGGATINATDANFKFELQPFFDQGQ
jgi:hypothetical protein